MVAVLVFLAGCTYGPAEERANIENVRRQPGTYRFAVAVRYHRFQPATGINRFPNGGASRFLEKTAIVYLVDASKDTITEIARFEAPEQLQGSFGIHLIGWKDGRVYAQLSGCPGRECYGDLTRFRHFRLSADADPVRITSRPRETERTPGMLLRAPGEEVYMRVSADSKVIAVRTGESAPFVDRYRVESSGDLLRVD